MSREYQHHLAEKAAAGIYNLVAPIDYLLLSFLPDEGELFAGLHPMTESVQNLKKKFSTDQQKVLTSSLVSTRLRVLALQALAVRVKIGERDGGWQRTPAGVAELKKWEANKNGSSSSG